MTTVRQVVEQEEGLDVGRILGIGFDATCSLVVEGEQSSALLVGSEPGFNVIMWMDHRASKEAALINATKHKVLDYVGGAVSLEMQLPKLLWLKKHKPDVWKQSRRFFDLPDWLTYKASGSDTRSFCSVVCKWNYFVPSETEILGWDLEFFETIGLGDLAEDSWRKIGSEVLSPGQRKALKT